MSHRTVSHRKKNVFGKTLAVAAVLVASMLAGCYSAPIMPPTGLAFSRVHAPQSLAIAGQDLGTKTGEASCSAILALVAFGDCSAKTAADAGGISELKQLDYRYMNIIGVYQQLTTIAYGN